MNLERKYLFTALTYAVLGLSLGIYMGVSQDHKQFVTHAHILLVGFIVSFVYAVIHKLWLGGTSTGLASVQFYLHQFASIVMFVALFVLFGRFLNEEQAGPLLGIASIGVLTGMVMMFWLVLRSEPNSPG